MATPTIPNYAAFGGHASSSSTRSVTTDLNDDVNLLVVVGGTDHTKTVSSITQDSVGLTSLDNYLVGLNRSHPHYMEGPKVDASYQILVTYSGASFNNGGAWFSVAGANLGHTAGLRLYERKSGGPLSLVSMTTTANVKAGERVVSYATTYGTDGSLLPTLSSYGADQTLLANDWSGEYSAANNGRIYILSTSVHSGADAQVTHEYQFNQGMVWGGHMFVFATSGGGQDPSWLF